MNYKHGMAKHPIYFVWQTMRQRCSNPKRLDYKYYGGEGKEVCEKWEKFETFRDDMLSTWKPGLTLDRIDNNKGYFPNNCRWVTRAQQAQNRRTDNGREGIYKVGNKYRVQKQKFGKRIHIGYFNTKEEAERAI
jgi:hypothetical protein